ncbi:MAG TPA: efflux RND transporter permease subunit, partial [Chromatiales bacterium]|nr:efflux RND transporter permease subunit [Chromatiales bacterium]
VVDRINAYLETLPDKYGADITYSTFQDFSRFTKVRLGVLTNNGIFGIILVFLSLLMFLRPSVALTTTWGLPVVFFSGLLALYAMGITFNLVSMLGFIMVLGMLVDDAIIIGENITYHMEQGMAPNDAAVKGARELIGPVTATVMTTVVAFVPLLFMSGLIGKFIVSIPVVVITLLVFSWLESFLILPNHVAHVTNPRRQPGEKRWLLAFENVYARVLGKALDYRGLTLLVSVLVLAGSVVLAKTSMTFQLFPATGIDEFVVRVTAPAGTSLKQMRQELRGIDTLLTRQINPDYLDATLLTSGQIAKDAGDPLTQRGSRFGQIQVIYIPSTLRPDHDALDDMYKAARELPQRFPHLQLVFDEVKQGPPTGRALQVEISSDDNALNEQVARRLM